MRPPYSSTVIPIERAVPATMLIAASRDAALRSGILVSAICFTCSLVIFATLVLFGVADAVSIPQAFLMRTAAGGVFVIKVNERSSYTVITTGITRPMSFLVRSLNYLVKFGIATPYWLSAGPTGGAGVALPA